MAYEREPYAYDAILLHREDKINKAENLCRTIIEYAKRTGRPLKISTYDSFCRPGRQELQNLNDAVQQAKYIVCMQDYYDESFQNTFFADAALQEKKKKSRFLLLKDGQPVETEHPARDSLQGSRLISDSELYANDLEKLVRELSGHDMTECIGLLSNKSELSTRTQSSRVTKDRESNVLQNDVEEDATPDSMLSCTSEVFPSARGGHGVEGQDLAEKSALPKQSKAVGEPKRNTNPKQEGCKQHTFDAVILHTDDEISLAESLSKDLQQHALQTCGNLLRIQLIIEVSHPGMQEIRNLDEILMNTKNIICSPAYVEQEEFSANVALRHKMKDRFFFLYFDCKKMVGVQFRHMRGSQITRNWQFVHKGHRDNLCRCLCGVDDDVTPEDMAENKSYSERPLINSVESLQISSQNSADDSSLTERKVEVHGSGMSSADENEFRSQHTSSSVLPSSRQRHDERTQEGSARGTNNSNNSRPRGTACAHISDHTDSLPGTSLMMDCSASQDHSLPVETHELRRSASTLAPEIPERERDVETSGTATSAARNFRPKMHADGAPPSSFPSDLQHGTIRRQQIPEGASHLHEDVPQSIASARPIAAIAPVRNQAEQELHSSNTTEREVVRNVADGGDGYHEEQVQRIPNVTDEQRAALREYNDGDGFL